MRQYFKRVGVIRQLLCKNRSNNFKAQSKNHNPRVNGNFLYKIALLTGIFCTAHLSLLSQVTLTASSGTASGTFTTLKEAFDAINNGTHQGAIVININANTTETGSAVLNGSGTGNASYTSVNIYPTSDGLSISGNLNTPLIDLNGADNVIIDGRLNATGSNKSLTIVNASDSSTPGTSTIRFINDASINTVKYCTLKGSSKDTASGIVYFSTTTFSTGNDNNTIDHNNITNFDNTNRPLHAVYALGTDTKNNDNNTISNNNIYDFLNPRTVSSGIKISNYNSGYTISGNSFYETTSFTSSSNVVYNVILVNAATGGGNGFNITGNYIGGSAPTCGGTAWTKINSNNAFTAIFLSTATGTVSSIQGNTIQNINWTNSSNASFYGIYLLGATDVNIGTVTGNTFGAATGTRSIFFTAGAPNSLLYGIYLFNSGSTVCSSNTIGSLTTASSSPTSNTDIVGIYKGNVANSLLLTINNNIIGSATTANSINASASATNTSQSVTGILNYGSGSSVISENLIANMVNSTTRITNSTGRILGIICHYGSTYIISRNTIRDLSIANGNSSTPTASPTFNSIGGIFVSAASSIVQTITNNTIYNLSNTYANFSGYVIGLFFTCSKDMEHIVSGNFIHSLSVSGASSSHATLCGIRATTGSTTFSNNIINLGGNKPTKILGIFESISTAGGVNKLYFNTVYISGNLAAGTTDSSYALFSSATTKTRDIRNNVLVNARSTAGATGKHFAAYIGSGGTLTCDYNNYYAGGTGGVLGYYDADKTSAIIVTGQDANSVSTNPYFVNPGTTAGGYSPTNPGTAVAGTGISVYFDSTARTSPTYMGALPSSPCTNPTSGGTIAAAQSGNAPFDPAAFTSSAAPSGESGPLEYKWQSSTTSSSAGFSDIASSDAATYDAVSLTQTTWFKRIARVGCKTDWTDAAESNVLEVTVIQTNTWTGGSGNWNSPSNWSLGVVPTGVVNIAISSGTITMDVDYTLTAGSTLTLSGTGALIIAPGKTLTIAGTADFGGKSVTIKSTADGTGAIGQITGTLSNATNVTQERYLPASSNGRAYRLISPGVNTTGSLRANWMEGGLNTAVGSNSNPNPGYGVQVTGSGGNANGFDVTASNAASIYTTVNGNTLSYAPIANTTDPLNALTGYFVFVRGDRSQDLTKPNTNVSPNPVPLPTSITTLRATGTVVQGTQNSFTNAMVSTNGAMNLITNPYPSAIDWAQVYAASSNIGNYYTLWDPKIGFRGGFVTVTTDGVKSDNSSSASTIIQPGQAFFVTATGGGAASVTLQESHKTSTGVSNAVFGLNTPTTSQLSVGLYYKEASGTRRLADGVKVVYGAGYQKTLDGNDAFEIPNWDENLAIKEAGKQLSIETRPTITGIDTLPLQIGNMKNMNYELHLDGANFSNPLLQAVLTDRYLQTRTPLNLNATTVLPFSVNTATPASYASDRFSVVFSTSATLPLKFRSFLGQVKGAQTRLEFEVETEANVTRYDIEKSNNGEAFTAIGNLSPKPASGLYNSYQWVDAASSGSSFYRIKAVSMDGSVQYSKVVKLTLGNSRTRVQAYPNPLRGKDFTLQLDQLEAGSYRLDWYNAQGQLMKTEIFQHPGGFYQHQPVVPTVNGRLQWKLSKGTNNWKGTIIQ